MNMVKIKLFFMTLNISVTVINAVTRKDNIHILNNIESIYLTESTKMMFDLFTYKTHFAKDNRNIFWSNYTTLVIKIE